MKYSIVLTETAQADLSAILRYIAVDLQSVQNANAQLSRIEKAIASLDQMPERYRMPMIQSAYHGFAKQNYTICQVDERTGNSVRHLIRVARIHFFKHDVTPFSHGAGAP